MLLQGLYLPALPTYIPPAAWPGRVAGLAPAADGTKTSQRVRLVEEPLPRLTPAHFWAV